MKKIILVILITFSSFVFGVQPEPGVNFKTTKEAIPNESKNS